ncbi:hypothetical protein BDV95DRAFT_302918 [Massariosphaeria phaeospora]|uniref:Uncharacterized protein n=1 Tax=Massariosphaeria phaeospora TaxID=100035 RepID=A0A7C8MEX8_9PLEO|nr:hypothetical protein BDV95DRAFT_302918 [Massariosphaeria phaeospora]
MTHAPEKSDARRNNGRAGWSLLSLLSLRVGAVGHSRSRPHDTTYHRSLRGCAYMAWPWPFTRHHICDPECVVVLPASIDTQFINSLFERTYDLLLGRRLWTDAPGCRRSTCHLQPPQPLPTYTTPLHDPHHHNSNSHARYDTMLVFESNASPARQHTKFKPPAVSVVQAKTDCGRLQVPRTPMSWHDGSTFQVFSVFSAPHCTRLSATLVRAKSLMTTSQSCHRKLGPFWKDCGKCQECVWNACHSPSFRRAAVALSSSVSECLWFRTPNYSALSCFTVSAPMVER